MKTENYDKELSGNSSINVAVFFGGCSSEYSVSLASAAGVIRGLNREKYTPVLVGITQDGRWFHFAGTVEEIEADTWAASKSCTPAVLSPNRGERRLLLLGNPEISCIRIDIALPVLHGRNGEDGTLQGLLELAAIPIAGCGTLASALCMDKDRAHKLAACAGVRVPKSIVLERRSFLPSCPDTRELDTAQNFARETGYPLFVKPVRAGSSCGVTRVTAPQQLSPALELAFQYDSQVILEENIEGFEVGCAVLGTFEPITGEIDEIELSGGFFDFTEKYTLKTSSIHVPARIDAAKAAEIKETAKAIYRALGCSGFARVDMFLTPEGEIVFNEVNTIPGFTEHSRYPGMMKAAGFTFENVLDKILDSARRTSPPDTGDGQAAAAGRAWIQIDRNALSANVALLRSLLPEGCRLMPALKANAYGHGAILIARELNRMGVDAFCVACIAEAISLRRADIKGEILILGYTPPEDFPLLIRWHLTQAVIDYPYAKLLARSGLKIHVHIGIDTGMHRLGIRCENIEDISAVYKMNNLVIDGMFTHFSASDSTDEVCREFTMAQAKAFYQTVEKLEAQGFPRPKLHLQASYGLLNYPGLNADFARAGISLYGVHSSVENASASRYKLAPVLSLMARVISVRTLSPGDPAGYGMTFIADRTMQTAVLSIGYADGLPGQLSYGRGYVLIHGRKAPVIGRVCMDLTLADISAIPQTQAGDAAVVIGRSGGAQITAEEVAAQCGTITNELLSRLGERLDRILD